MGESDEHGGQQKLKIMLLGGFHVAVGERVLGDGEWRLRKVKSLVKLLALAPGHRLHREQVMDTLWPDLDPTAASNNLRKALHLARRTLEPGNPNHPKYLQLHGDLLLLCERDTPWIDVETFESVAATARRTGDPSAYEAAVALYAGELLPEDRYEDWTIRKREELHNLYLSLLVELAGLLDAGGKIEPAMEVLQRAVSADPAREEAYAALMRLYAQTGQRHQALRQYRLLREALREIDVEPEEATRQLYEDISAGHITRRVDLHSSQGGHPGGKWQPGRHNLPAQLTSFVGREREIEEVERLLSTTRLFTLTGPGGCGKTRLAIEVASRNTERYQEGVWLTELAALSDSALAPQAVAQTLGVPVEPGQPLVESLSKHIGHKSILLLLDNCEHMVTACAQLAEALLRACPNLRVLATSREALNIAGEVVWPVPSLSMPEAERLPTLDDLMRYEAVRLFADRASAAVPGFSVTKENAEALAQVCRRLDGIPLAIELAAPRVRALSVQQIAARLEGSFALLAAGSRTALPRHQTLSATIEWSFNLLSEGEKALFRRLSVFAGAFTLEAAEAVCAGEPIGKEDVFELLSHLVDRSLVIGVRVPASREMNYRLLETLRQYGQERLAEEGEELADRHAAYYLGFSEMVDQGWPAINTELMSCLEREHDNVRAALAWYRERDPQSGLRLAGNLWRFWDRYNHLTEGRTWLDGMLEAAPTPDSERVRGKALLGAGRLAQVQGDSSIGCSCLDESIAIFRKMGDKSNLAAALHYAGHAASDLGDYEGANSLFSESLALCRAIGFTRLIQTLVGDLGFVALQRGDCATARPLLEESLTRLREISGASAIPDMLLRLGDLARVEGKYEEATSRYMESLDDARKTEDELSIASAYHKLGQVSKHNGDYTQARALFEESLAMQRQAGNKQGILECLAGLAAILGHEGQYRRAAILFGAVDGFLDVVKVPLGVADRADYDHDLAATRAVLDDETFNAAWAEGRRIALGEGGIEQAINLV